MKTITVILTLFLFSVSGIIYASQDSTKNNEPNIRKNYNESENNQENGKCYRGKRNDKFIDKDGDGICDERNGKVRKGKKHQRGKNK